MKPSTGVRAKLVTRRCLGQSGKDRILVMQSERLMEA